MSPFQEVAMEDDIKEGFICPMCMKDLGAAVNLQKHFEEYHSEDRAGLRQIRGMLGKAKRKIMEKIEISDQSDGSRNASTGPGVMSDEEIAPKGMDPFLWDNQEFGELQVLPAVSSASATVVVGKSLFAPHARLAITVY